jgi:hypothetical protein
MKKNRIIIETSEVRKYKCKDEELPSLCRNALHCYKRDLPDFTALSPAFNDDHVNEFEAKINMVEELVLPQVEANELKQITRRLYETMDSLLDPIARIRGYLLLAKDTIEVSAKDFGLAMLSRKISDRNAEGTHKNLLFVISMLEKYREPLIEAGFSDTTIEQFNDAVSSITDDNRLQFDIISKRKKIVQTNLSILNDLYAQLKNILTTGRLLYKKTNPVKYREYTFGVLRKNIRRIG